MLCENNEIKFKSNLNNCKRKKCKKKMYILFIERPFIKMLNRLKNETILNVKRSRAL